MKNPLLQRLADCHPPYGTVAVCRLGQHSFLLKGGETLVALDPYLSEDASRLIPPLIAPGDFSGMAVICGSHDHGDHIDRPALGAMAQASPAARFVFPEAVRPTITEIPPGRIAGMNDGQVREFGGVRIAAVASAHEFLDRTPDGLYPYLGYVVALNGVVVYHSGDCCVYEGLLSRLDAAHPDLAMLPINGRDAKRLSAGCIGNMTYQEAADLAGWLRIPMVIPAHYDMFAMNLEDPGLFRDYVRVKYPRLGVRLLAPGEIFLFSADRKPSEDADAE